MSLTTAEKSILTAMLKKRVFMNTSEIARLSGVSWNTADKYLKSMHNRGWLHKSGSFWMAKRQVD